jgi:hypothetical protein
LGTVSVIRRIAEAIWDEASFRLAREGNERPRLVATASWVAERAQRPILRARFADGPVRLAFHGNDRQLFSALARTLGASPSAEVTPDVTAREIAWFQAETAMREGAVVLPRWVGLEVDLARERLDERRRASMRRANARGLFSEVVPAEHEIESFYERFYRPTALARHGEDAFVRRLPFLRRAAKGASIVWVRGDERLAGALLVPRRDRSVVDAWVTGVRDGVYEAESTVRDALYVFAMRRARDVGARTLGLTAAPPFLGDGLLRYKKSFGARTVPVLTSPIAVRLDVHRMTDALAAAFARSSPIVLARGSADLAAWAGAQ